jgi:hypothetical protein
MANLAIFIHDSYGSGPLAVMLAVASDSEASLVTLHGLADMALDGQFLRKPIFRP